MTSEFFNRYKYKLRTKDALLSDLGSFPREKDVVMCHGVFDVVHPGHIRHLAYAKSKADILVVSITSDKHINKGIYRPHIPEDLRALNLAAFEMVDYVIIDGNDKPLNLIESIQPDFFAKGFEYSASGLPPATQEELNLLEVYGGKLIFTPGDVVYSSTNLINSSLPQVQIEKLLTLMQVHSISFNDLRNALRNLKGQSVLVVGDTIIDSYTRTTLIGGQTKTPTFSVLYQKKDDYIGGAGIVAQHLGAAGANVEFLTLLGNDNLKEFAISRLRDVGVNIKPMVDEARPTTNKNVIIAEGYRLLKVDTLDNRPIANNVLDFFVKNIAASNADIVVFSDFRHGIFNKTTVPILTKAIPVKAFKVADSQVASRWGNITEFKNFDLITPNEREARFALGDQDSTVGKLSKILVDETNCTTLMLKLGDRGVYGFEAGDVPENDLGFSIDSFADRVLDAVGAGDAFLAYSSLALRATCSPIIAGILGSIAAACECEIDGNKPIFPEAIASKIDNVEKLVNYQFR